MSASMNGHAKRVITSADLKSFDPTRALLEEVAYLRRAVDELRTPAPTTEPRWVDFLRVIMVLAGALIIGFAVALVMSRTGAL